MPSSRAILRSDGDATGAATGSVTFLLVFGGRFLTAARWFGCGFGGGGLAAGAAAAGWPPSRKRDEPLADADLVAGLHVNFGDDAGGRGRNRSHGLFIFQFEDGLILGDRVAFLHEDIDHDAGIRAFTELGKFYIHKINQANSVAKNTAVFQK